MLEVDCPVTVEIRTSLGELITIWAMLLTVTDVRLRLELPTRDRLTIELPVDAPIEESVRLAKPIPEVDFCVTLTKLTTDSCCSISILMLDTLTEVFVTRYSEVLPCTCTEDVAFCVEGVRLKLLLLTSCRLGTLLAVVAATVVEPLKVTAMLEVAAAVVVTVCNVALPFKAIEDVAGTVLDDTVAADLLLKTTEGVASCVDEEIVAVDRLETVIVDVVGDVTALMVSTAPSTGAWKNSPAIR